VPREVCSYLKRKIAMAKSKKHKDDDPCWKGYEQLGMKKKDGKKVPDCVPKKK
jgi:hypothetical protein